MQRSARFAEFCFTVSDNGIGMSKEFLSHIFEPFVRAQDTRAGTVEGSGLGMAIVRHLIDMMGGTFNIESEIGVGSTFTVYLPFRISETEPDCGTFSRHGISKILLVDRDLCFYTSILSATAGIGLDIQCASNKTAALELLHNTAAQSRAFDMILLDQQPLDEIGSAIAENVQKERNCPIPIFY